MADKPHYLGHRRRLRERFLKSGGAGLPDYEILELLLSQALPRRDLKPLAKDLLARFGSFAAVISAEPARIAQVAGMGEAAITALKLAQEASVRLLREEAAARPVLSSWQALLDYCQAGMGHGETEAFRILFLDRKNALIADEVQQTGTVDHVPVYPREVVKRALDLGASAIIMVHNHPSGDPTPSKGDIDMTAQVMEAAHRLGIALHDHIVIAKGRHASLKSMGLL